MIDGSCDFYVTVVHERGFVLSSLDYLYSLIGAVLHLPYFRAVFDLIQRVDRKVCPLPFTVVGWDSNGLPSVQEGH